MKTKSLMQTHLELTRGQAIIASAGVSARGVSRALEASHCMLSLDEREHAATPHPMLPEALCEPSQCSPEPVLRPVMRNPPLLPSYLQPSPVTEVLIEGPSDSGLALPDADSNHDTSCKVPPALNSERGASPLPVTSFATVSPSVQVHLHATCLSTSKDYLWIFLNVWKPLHVAPTISLHVGLKSR